MADLDSNLIEEFADDLCAILHNYPNHEFVSRLSDEQQVALKASIERLQQGSSPFAIKQLSSEQPFASLVDDTFGGLLHSRITCLDCEKMSDTIEPCYDLSLPVTPPIHRAREWKPVRKSFSDSDLVKVRIDVLADEFVKLSTISNEQEMSEVKRIQEEFANIMRPLRTECSVSDCLRAFFATEILQGANAFDCSHCGGRSICSKRYTIEKPPPVLVLHLKRFNGEGRRLSKQDKRINVRIRAKVV